MSSLSVQDTISSSFHGAQKDVLEAAAKMVHYHMLQDDSFSDCLKMGGELPKVSGLGNYEYAGMSELGLDFQSHGQLNVVKKVPLPPELVEQFGFMQAHCQMGLFTEIGRAYLTIDTNIFLWSYLDGSDLAYYDGISTVITCVGLVKPKPGVFQSFIDYVLCIATITEIVLLGVSFGSPSDSSSQLDEMHLLSEPLFSFPTDDVKMNCFCGTDNGRIFLGGGDGCVYEFTYQAADGWFSRKCRKINHSTSAISYLVPSIIQAFWGEDDPVQQLSIDNSRNILYARTDKGSIQVFDLGKDGNQMSRVIIMHYQNILNNASAIAETVNQTNFTPVVSICAIEASESSTLNLVAVTKSGVRLYFSTTDRGESSRPYTLCLLHVRLPPGFSAKAVVDHLTNVHASIYKKGFAMMAASVVDDHDVLFAASNDLFVFQKYFIETYTAMKLDGHTWAMCEIPLSRKFKAVNVQPFVSPVSVDPPLMVTQHAEFPRQFVVLSDQGCCILSKPRPVDQLCRLLNEHRGPDNDALKAYFGLFTKAQACAMCLILICSRNLQDKQVAEWATRAFLMYGGNPILSGLSPGDAPATGDAHGASPPQLNAQAPVWTSTPANNLQPFSAGVANPQLSAVGSPMRSVFSASQNIPVSSPHPGPQQYLPETSISPSLDICYSGKHNGLHLYFSRLIRPLWNLNIVYERNRIPPDSGPPYLCSTVMAEDLSLLLQELCSLRDFMQMYQPYFGNGTNTSAVVPGFTARQYGVQSPSPIQDTTAQLQNRAQNDADLQERASILNLQHLVSYTCEVLGLWKVLLDHQFEAITNLLSTVDQDQLKQANFKEFIVDGKEVCIALTKALISFYLDDNAGTSAVTDRLREVCPSIFRTEDATVSKAQEFVISAQNTVNQVEREQKLMEALKLCKSVCPNLDLKSMCNLFYENRFYYGLVDLCVCMSQRLDPQNYALHYYRNDEPPNDIQGQQAFEARMECYKIVTNAINNLVTSSLSHPQSGHIPVSPGPQPQRTADQLTPEEARSDSELVFEMALKTDDELFHSAIYDWLISTNQTNALLSIKSHFLQNYLKRRTTMHPDNQQSLDLLWKYYEKCGNFSAAARVLAMLADKHGIDLSLAQRLEYLSRAIISIKSSEMRISTAGEGEFLHELEEKIEVARIQLQILQALQQKKIPSVQEAIAKLNSNFLDITTLYEEFAVPYNLPENKLAIVHCAGHYDPSLIESLWQSIIDKELLASCGNVPDARVKILQQKLQAISQPYVSCEKYFPADFIIEYLEIKTCSTNLSQGWVYHLMMSLGFSLKELLNIYHKMYRSKDSCWPASTKPLHLLQVLCLMIGEFIKNPLLVPQNERRAFITQCLDVIAGYLVDLQATSIANPIVPSLMKEFKSTQHNLERML